MVACLLRNNMQWHMRSMQGRGKKKITRACDTACAGEIGQVGKSTYLHGFTAAVGILREDIDMEEQNL